MHINMSRDLWQDPWFLVGLSLTLLFAGLALLGPPLAPFDPWDISFYPHIIPFGRASVRYQRRGAGYFFRASLRHQEYGGLWSLEWVNSTCDRCSHRCDFRMVRWFCGRDSDEDSRHHLSDSGDHDSYFNGCTFSACLLHFSPYLSLSDVANHRQGDQGTDPQPEGEPSCKGGHAKWAGETGILSGAISSPRCFHST